MLDDSLCLDSPSLGHRGGGGIGNGISRSCRKSNEARCAIYERARTARRQALRDYEPSLLANEQVALEAAVCRVEGDLVLREAS
jgi:hypothetical protein